MHVLPLLLPKFSVFLTLGVSKCTCFRLDSRLVFESRDIGTGGRFLGRGVSKGDIISEEEEEVNELNS